MVGLGAGSALGRGNFVLVSFAEFTDRYQGKIHALEAFCVLWAGGGGSRVSKQVLM
jgi:hypothetical protein